MNTSSYEIDSDIVVSSNPSVEKLRRALANEIHPSTEREEKLVRRLAHHLWGLRDIPEIANALFPWLRMLGYGELELSQRTDQHVGSKGCLVSQYDFILGDFSDPDEEEKGFVSPVRFHMRPAFEALYSDDLADTLSPDEARHVRKYKFFAQELRLLVWRRRFEECMADFGK